MLNQDVVTLLEGKPPSLLPEALKSSAVGAVCVIDSRQLDGTFLLLKKRLIGC